MASIRHTSSRVNNTRRRTNLSILAPTDFGLVAIAMSVVSVMESALDMPVNQALLQLQTITGPQYDTAFTLSLMRGLVLSLLVLLIAWPFAQFYSDDRLKLLVCFLSLAPTARGLISPRLAEFQKGLSFWRDFALELGGKLTAFAVGVTVALITGSYWSIAAGMVIFPLAGTIGSYILAPYRPRLSLSALGLFTGFIGWMSVAQIVGALNWQFERLLLGKLTTATRLGLFTASSDVASIPFMAFFGPVIRPLLAAFSHIRDDPKRLGQSYLSASNAIVAVGLPVLVGESLVADPIVRLILGEKWLGAISLVHWLALSLIPALLALPAAPLVMSFGQTRMFLFRSFIELGVKFPIALIGAIEFGFPGIIAARLVSELVASSYSIIVVRRFTGLSALDQILVSWRCAVATAVMVPPVLLCLRLVGSGTGPVHAAFSLFCVGATGAAVYVSVIGLLWLMSGRPAGVEAMAVRVITNSLDKVGRPRWLAFRFGIRAHRPATVPKEGSQF
ncbi:MAG: oligosaccharide flippase family protein [Rhodopila sp.]